VPKGFSGAVLQDRAAYNNDVDRMYDSSSDDPRRPALGVDARGHRTYRAEASDQRPDVCGPGPVDQRMVSE
jgi:hypothetical protein